MDTKKELERFVKFSLALERETRETLVDYIWGFFASTTGAKHQAPVSDLLVDYIPTIKAFLKPEVVQACAESPRIRNDVTARMVSTFESTFKDVCISGPFQEEDLLLMQWKKKTDAAFFRTAGDLLDRVEEFYPGRSYLPYLRKLLLDLPREREKRKAIRQEIMDKWGGELKKKKDAAFLEALDSAREEACAELYAQMEKLAKMKRVLAPFVKELGRLWDLSRGAWQDVGFEILDHYATLLEKEPELQQLAELLGRLHAAEQELERVKVEQTIVQPKLEVYHAGRSEFVGVHESNDLNNLVPAELCLLEDPLTELLFYKKFAERKLLTYDFIGYDWGDVTIQRTVEEERPKGTKKGPIIICVDTSGSMHGIPERVAKVLAFAILRVALRENRKCFLISFSTQIKTLELTTLQKSFPALIDFLGHSFHGGTDATPALEKALEMLETHEYRRADVLMISDFIMDGVNSDLERRIHAAREQETKFFSTVISRVANPASLEFFDRTWVYGAHKEGMLKEIVGGYQRI